MLLSQVPYQRADAQAAAQEYERLTQVMQQAKTAEEAIQCVLDANRVLVSFHEACCLAKIRYTQNIADEFYAGEQAFYAANSPAVMEKQTGFKRAMLASPFRPQMEERFGKIIFTNAEIDERTISPEVLDLIAEEQQLVLDYQKLQGSITVEFRGQTLTVPQMALYMSDADRATRKEATEAAGRAMGANNAEYDRIYDEMVRVRTAIAKKLGFNNFVELGYLRMNRNCYTPEDVQAFRQQVKDDIVPLVSRLKAAQAKRIGVEPMYFYDEDVLTAKGNPNPNGTGEDIMRAGVEMFNAMKPETRALMDKMVASDSFDLFSRPGKMTGGYCEYIIHDEMPMIFSNFNGTAGDVEVFCHEGGHCLAAYTERVNELQLDREPTNEAAEIHSMSMEYLCWPHFERFYGDRAEEARVIHLISKLYFLPYGCLVDEFQHEMYLHPELTPEERCQTWLRLEKEYFPHMNYEDLTFYGEGRRWQRQLHIYQVPFYYIDYCIAEACALQTADMMLNEGWEQAWDRYYRYMEMGGRFTLLEMLDKAGFKNPFKPGALTAVAKTAQEYIDKHPLV